MKYSEIIGEIANNMGFEGLANQYERPIKNAIYWALSELTRNSEALKGQITFDINKDTNEYEMPEDFYRPRKVIIWIDGYGLRTEEVELEEILEFRYNVNSELSLRYSDKILYNFRHINNKIYIYIYPSIDGKCYVSYDVILPEIIDINSDMEPNIPATFHTVIIEGATYYMARKKISELAKSNDPNMLLAWRGMIETYKNSFEKGKEEFIQFGQKRAEPIKIKGWNFYDKGEEYL